MSKYLRSCDVIELVVVSDWVVKSKCSIKLCVMKLNFPGENISVRNSN